MSELPFNIISDASVPRDTLLVVQTGLVSAKPVKPSPSVESGVAALVTRLLGIIWDAGKYAASDKRDFVRATTEDATDVLFGLVADADQLLHAAERMDAQKEYLRLDIGSEKVIDHVFARSDLHSAIETMRRTLDRTIRVETEDV